MSRIEFFSPPEGEFITDPEPGWLKDLILNKGEDYWCSGAGQASLKRFQDGTTVELLLTMAPGHGFYLEFIDADDVYFISIGDGRLDETVTVYVGGNPLVLPTGFLIPKELALLAVQTFCRNGGRCKAVQWKRQSEVNWHYGFPE